MSTSEISPGQALAGAGAPSGASPIASVGPAAAGAGAAPQAQALGQLIEQLANQYFSGVPGPAIELGRQSAPGLPIAVDALPAPGPVAPPPGVFPSATSVGA